MTMKYKIIGLHLQYRNSSLCMEGDMMESEAVLPQLEENFSAGARDPTLLTQHRISAEHLYM